MVGVAAVILLGGAVVAPLASASDRWTGHTRATGGGVTADRGGFGWQWVQEWRRQARPGRPGGGTPPGTGGGGTPPGSGGAGACSDVEVLFARGTGEPQGLGIVGRPFAEAVRANLPGRTVSTYAVVYGAAFSQATAGAGATDMSRRVTAVAARCPATRFVIGGYSQGATVTDIAIGIRGAGTSSGTPIPANLAPRVAAVVVFGNPLGLSGRTIAGSSATYGPKAREFCNSGDPVCGGGANFAAHVGYASNGATTAGGRFAAARVNG